jgi:hypothetical protein
VPARGLDGSWGDQEAEAVRRRPKSCGAKTEPVWKPIPTSGLCQSLRSIQLASQSSAGAAMIVVPVVTGDLESNIAIRFSGPDSKLSATLVADWGRGAMW